MEKIEKKPSLDLVVKAELVGKTELENNIKEVKKTCENLKTYYMSNPFIDKDIKLDFENKDQMEEIKNAKGIAKEEKAKVNKLKEEINSKSKSIVEKYNEPLAIFLETKKETIGIIEETYAFINKQVLKVDDDMKAEKEKQIKELFKETKELHKIDFIKYEDVDVNVTLNASMKSLKAKVVGFVEKVVDDLKLIDTQEYKAEILVEYKKDLNVSNAITTVSERNKAIEEQKAKEEANKLAKIEEEKRLAKLKEVEEEVKISVPVTETQQEIPNAEYKEVSSVSVEEAKEETKLFKFQIELTRERFEELTKLLKEEGYKYEWIK